MHIYIIICDVIFFNYVLSFSRTLFYVIFLLNIIIIKLEIEYAIILVFKIPHNYFKDVVYKTDFFLQKIKETKTK